MKNELSDHEKNSCAMIVLSIIFALGCLCGSVIGGMAALFYATY